MSLQKSQLGDCVDGFVHAPYAVVSPRVFEFLSILCGEIYPILKPFLMTAHCCQACVLSMMLWCFAAPTAGYVLARVVSDCAIRKLLGVSRSLTSSRPAKVGYEKYSSHLIFIFYLDRNTSVPELFPVVLFQWIKKLAGLWLVGEVVTSIHHDHVGTCGSKTAEGCLAFQRWSCIYTHAINQRIIRGGGELLTGFWRRWPRAKLATTITPTPRCVWCPTNTATKHLWCLATFT